MRNLRADYNQKCCGVWGSHIPSPSAPHHSCFYKQMLGDGQQATKGGEGGDSSGGENIIALALS